MSHKSQISYQHLFRKPGTGRSISFSIAYVRVCEWAREPTGYPRPKPDILARARDHAQKLGDAHILEKIQECFKYYEKTDQTPTPKLPKSTDAANEVSRDITQKVRQITQPYSTSLLTMAEKIDRELDDFLNDMKRRGL